LCFASPGARNPSVLSLSPVADRRTPSTPKVAAAETMSSPIRNSLTRRAGEISVIRAGINAELHERLSDVPIADKARRIAVDGMLRDDLLAKLEDPDLEPRLRNQYTKTVMALQRAVAEELGDLRTTVDLTTTRSLADFDEVVLNEETGVYSAVAGTLHNASDG
jgi:hypothetical protein